MDTLAYVINWAVWSAAGFAAGYYVCHLTSEVHDIRQRVVDDEEVDTPHERPRSRSRQPVSRRALTIFGALVIGLSLLVVAQGTIAQINARDEAKCHNRVSEDLREEQLKLQQAYQQDWSAMRAYLEEVSDGQAVDKASERLFNLLQEYEENRALNPAAAYVRDTC